MKISLAIIRAASFIGIVLAGGALVGAMVVLKFSAYSVQAGPLVFTLLAAASLSLVIGLALVEQARRWRIRATVDSELPNPSFKRTPDGAA